ncbi:MAG: glycosyltransferase [Prevotella sp.]|nr:glycosyltransferase [Bacteroides sp.]MCM1366590.1 glycosyltransferase [Prevotella sp.]MCM1437313.1 glycosyltransferase [Prevotella sp.]
MIREDIGSNPYVSIVMPAYNAEKYIDAAIISVLHQSYADWELVVVDDGSTDNTMRILQKYAAKDSRIKVFRLNPPAHRAFEPRKTAVLKAKGEWISKLDADDLIEKDALSKLIATQKKFNADIVYPTVYSFVDTENNCKKYPLEEIPVDKSHTGRTLLKKSLNGWKFGACGGLTRKSIYQTIYQKYDYPKQNYFIDEICTRHILLEDPVIAFSNSKYYYRSNPESFSNEQFSRIFDYMLVDFDLLSICRENYGVNSEEYLLAQKQNFYRVFDMYKRMNRISYTRGEKEKAYKMIRHATEQFDWKILNKNISFRYSLLSHLPHSMIRLALTLFNKK